jgi:hypothetical protein
MSNPNPGGGRSRGRARVAGVPGTPASAAPPSGGPPLHQQAYQGAAQTKTPSPPAGVDTPSPPTAQQPNVGRGRGFSTTSSESVITVAASITHSATTATAVSVVSTGTTGERVSPPFSEDSPPQQPSPPQTTGQAMGRAAMRGGTHQPGPATRLDMLKPMERMTLQDTGDFGKAPAAPREMRYEQVLHTRPENCDVKTGTAGAKIKILCNYFEVLSEPNWVLHQYHVDFAPVIESRRMRIALMHLHDKLFPTNKAFDGSTIYSLTKLEKEVSSTLSCPFLLFAFCCLR